MQPMDAIVTVRLGGLDQTARPRQRVMVPLRLLHLKQLNQPLNKLRLPKHHHHQTTAMQPVMAMLARTTTKDR